MNNKIKVAMLPTGDKSCICMTKNKIYFYPQNNWFSKDYETQPLHLYVTVSQNVIGGKEVYYIDKFTNKVTSSGGAEYGENQDVVIATTDTKIHYKGEFNEKLGRKTFADVPQVSQSFLKEYVANPDGEYEVEYHFTGRCEDPMICLRGCSVYEGTCKHHLDKGINLKLNKDNTVSITSVNNRSNKIKSIAEELRVLVSAKAMIPLDDWIKENL